MSPTRRPGLAQPALFDPERSSGVLMTPAELSARLGETHPPTPEQVGAVSAPLQPHVVVAGAGSGKTQTMALRVVWLVANGLVEPHRVLGLTFTRKAATELGERVRRMLARLRHADETTPFLADDVAAALRTGEPTVTTYHSYAATLVGEHALRIGMEPTTRLIGEAISWQYAARVVSAYDGDMDAVDRAASTVIGDVLALAAELSEHLAVPADVVTLSQRVRRHLETLPRADSQRTTGHYKDVLDLLGLLESRVALLPLVDAYTGLKRAGGAMDYGDQVAVAARIAREHPEVGEIERGRFGAVLLDEYQDTGEAQRVLLTSVFRGGHPVTAVGDPRQSIYGWRGASAGNLERFAADFAGATPPGSSRLTVSFRNGEGVLSAANLVADGIPVRSVSGSPDSPDSPGSPGSPGSVDSPVPAVDHYLTPGPGRAGRGRVVVALHPTVMDEAAWVADQLASLVHRHADGTIRRLDEPVDWGSVAVLARKRSHFPRLETALRERGIPCEVVGLGGLLHEPEVVDVVATLRVLADPAAGGALVRLLAGPRWRLGPRDLDALGRRARHLAVSHGVRPVSASSDPELAEEVEPDPDEVDERSLIDALDDPGAAAAYSTAGYTRIVALRDELRRLRRLTSAALPDLVMAVVRSLGLDVELASRSDVRAADALLDVDRLVEVAEDFVASGEDPGLLAFLAYLDTADERERGLEVELAEPDGSRVQLMTVHAAKGLEWDVVAVAGLASTVFPVTGQPVANWAKQVATLPFPLRGDRAELPVLGWEETVDQVGAHDAVGAFVDACKARGALEERRLAYVAVTRARDLLLCSGYWWDTVATRRGPSDLLLELHDLCAQGAAEVGVWTPQPADDETNPLSVAAATAPWPFDPLGPRRPQLLAAAELVRAWMAGVGRSASGPDASRGDALESGDSFESADTVDTEVDRATVAAWDHELELLLAELARQRELSSGGDVVELPGRLSVSQLVQLARDPADLARSLRRPLPRRPAPLARRGTLFHLWLEARWGQQRLLDVDELPGSADETAQPDDDLRALQAAFDASPWAARVPTEIELPFDLVVDGVQLRGRCDAVFTDAADGLVDVVDWKTGPPQVGAEARASAVQLAVYRLAWHHLTGVPLGRIRAAFHHVAAGVTVRPADLLDEADLVALVRSVPMAVDA